MDYQNQNQGDENLYSPENLAGGKAPAGGRRSRPPKTKTSGGFFKVLMGIMLVLSILGNLVLFLVVIFMGAFLAGGAGQDMYREVLVREGDAANKIVVIRLEGAIDGEMSEHIRRQLDTVRDDPSVKGIIIRTISPGGGVSASDQIHHEILSYIDETENPAITFMQTVAASGGYYTSVATDWIVAEPTVITGSIGVLMTHMGMETLFEEKLGVNTNVVRSSPRKAWPSMFDEFDEEGEAYLMEKLIVPAYDRFVTLVDEGREDLDLSEVQMLADGSIYSAQEALDHGLIDEIGYMDTAIAAAERLAGIENARVVEYAEIFTWASILQSQENKLVNLSVEDLELMAVPRLMYLWRGW